MGGGAGSPTHFRGALQTALPDYYLSTLAIPPVLPSERCAREWKMALSGFAMVVCWPSTGVYYQGSVTYLSHNVLAGIALKLQCTSR